MTLSGPTFDAEGMTLAWAKAYPGLIGPTAPIVGMFLSPEVRSPNKGVIATLRVITASVDGQGLGHSARILFEVLAIGGEGGAKKQAERAARALSDAVGMLDGTPVLVTCDGVTAKLVAAHTVNGPIWIGAPKQSTYRLEATFIFQAA